MPCTSADQCFFLSKKGILESIFLGINLVSLRGNNVVDPKDAFVMALANQGGDGEEGDSNVVKDIKKTPDAEAMTIELAKDPPSSEVNVPLS